MYVSELYGKKIITNTGHWIGEVGEVVLDLEGGAVSHLLIGKFDRSKPKEMMRELFKNSVEFKKVKKISETIVVSNSPSPAVK
jgi:sporulation protein YlmC with PRC-barrel domain